MPLFDGKNECFQYDRCAIYALVIDDGAPLYIKLGGGALYGGLALLLLSVLRQQLIARKTDRYKDVQR